MAQKQGNIGKVIDKSPWWAPWLVFIILAAGMIANSVHTNSVQNNSELSRVALRDASVESCERVNLLRDQFNRQNVSLREFMLAAAATRQASADAAPPGSVEQNHNQAAADRYRALVESVQDVDIPNCEEVFPQNVSFEVTTANTS